MNFPSDNSLALYVGKKFFNKCKKPYFNKNFKKSSDSKGENSGSKPFEKKSSLAEKKCYYCKKIGHHIRDYRTRIAEEKTNSKRNKPCYSQ